MNCYTRVHVCELFSFSNKLYFFFVFLLPTNIVYLSVGTLLTNSHIYSKCDPRKFMIPLIICMANKLKVYNTIMLSCTLTCYTSVTTERTKILTSIIQHIYKQFFVFILPFSQTHKKKHVIG